MTPQFDYVRPATVAEAATLLADTGHANRVLAGGTDLMVQLHHHAPNFDRIIDISLLPELKIINRNGDTISLGSAVTFTEITESNLLREAVPFMVEGCREIGGPQIRNMGTLGGNVVNAASCADGLPALVCLDALVHLRSARGERQLPVAEFMLKPGHTRIEPDEILTHFSFTAPPPGAKTAFIKLGRRNAQAISRLVMTAIGRVDAAGRIDFMRLTPGAATPRIVRFTAAEDLLLGQQPSAQLFTAAGRAVAETMIGITGRRWSTEFKEPVITALTQQILYRIFEIGA
ncbi:MAG: Nicotinate dehydrogenase FAD-subunit [Anaerolineae bacterium]|nr:Nicotinate dehydrogenase FAD-subunit [Anaerolineae bacterium]